MEPGGAALHPAFSLPCMLGIDEAGRGPVLGPMVYGACYCPLAEENTLRELGVADSKTLDEAQRDERFERLSRHEKVGHILAVLMPDYLSHEMLRRTKHNLNEISHETAISLIQQALARGVNLQKVFVDTVGDPKKYEAKLKHKFPSLEIAVRAKADSLFPAVSAASIFAKVTRDKILREWSFPERGVEFDRRFGSGYTSDPVTVEWLRRHCDIVFGYPSLIRFSWATTRRALEQHAAPVDWGYASDEADAEDDDAAQSKLTTFLVPGKRASIGTIGKRGRDDDDDGDDDDNENAGDGSTTADGVSGEPGRAAVRSAKRHAFFEERALRIVRTLG